MKYVIYLLFIVGLISCNKQPSPLVFMTDYGLKDGAVNAMKGVSTGVDRSLMMHDITHEIPAFNVWEAAYRLQQVAAYWPEGTVFVIVVDPGVGTERRSIVMKSNSGHYFVCPDNGTLTLVAQSMGIKEIREIDEKINRIPGSTDSYTFHGRDLYAYTGARLASAKISFEEVGPLLKSPLMMLDYQKPIVEGNMIKGNIPVLDIQYGNVWTNIHDSLLKKINIKKEDSLDVQINQNDSMVWNGRILFVNTFGDVNESSALGYINSLMNFSLAINMGNFAEKYKISSGQRWSILLRKA